MSNMHITMLLDKSASMEDIWSDTLGGFNLFIDDQKATNESMTLSLYQFATELETSFVGKPMNKVIKLNKETYRPDGASTALVDSTIKAIEATQEYLNSLDKKPEKILFVVQTDGLENASRKYNHSELAEIIKHKELSYNWKFVFLGAGLEAFSQNTSMGFTAGNGLKFNKTAKGNDALYRTFSNSVTTLNSVSSSDYSSRSAFTQEDFDLVDKA